MKTTTVLAGLVVVLVLIATASGIFLQTPGAPIPHTTVRGEEAVYQGSGLYHWDPAWLAKEGAVWDTINLFIGLPLLALAIYLSQRNSLRGRLLLGGLLFYYFYVYLLSMTGYAFNRMFLVYVAIMACSGVGFFLNLHSIDVAQLPARISPRFPRRLFIGFTFVMSALLLFLWMGRILPIMASDRLPADMAGLATLQSQGVDLGIIVPLLLSAGILLWRRSPWGYLLTSVTLSYGLLMCIAIPAWIVVPLVQDGKANLLQSSPFLTICLVGLGLTAAFYRSIQAEKG